MPVNEVAATMPPSAIDRPAPSTPLEPSSLSWLAGLAAAIAFTHTLLGPDHYLPLAVTARAGRWSFAKTMAVVTMCGTGHVLSSLLLGVIGIVVGVSVSRLEGIESWRGDLAAWALLVFGLCYAGWGVRRAARRVEHRHVHAHADGTIHAHQHSHQQDHLHAHPTGGSEKDLSSWMLFSIFLLGPCEPLIPILMYPAARGGMAHVLVVAAVFGVVTLVTMLAATAVAWLGMARFTPRLPLLERWSHGIAGALISLSAIGVLFLGL